LLEGSGLDSVLEGNLDTGVDSLLIGAHLEVGHDVLDESLPRRTGAVHQGVDGGSLHLCVLEIIKNNKLFGNKVENTYPVKSILIRISLEYQGIRKYKDVKISP